MSDFDDAFNRASQPPAPPPPPPQNLPPAPRSNKRIFWIVGGVLVLLAIFGAIGSVSDDEARKRSEAASAKVREDLRKQHEEEDRRAAERKPEPEPRRPFGAWAIDESKSDFDDTKGATAQLVASNEIEGWPRQKSKPTLLLRCKEKTTDLYVITEMRGAVEYGNLDHATLRLRIDEGKAFENNASQSTDGKAYFLASPVAVAKRIMAGKEMLVQFTPFNSSPQTIRFDIEGAAEAFKPVRAACKW